MGAGVPKGENLTRIFNFHAILLVDIITAQRQKDTTVKFRLCRMTIIHSHFT